MDENCEKDEKDEKIKYCQVRFCQIKFCQFSYVVASQRELAKLGRVKSDFVDSTQVFSSQGI